MWKCLGINSVWSPPMCKSGQVDSAKLGQRLDHQKIKESVENYESRGGGEEVRSTW